jgi:glycosyltransferase involved in cell wall biosynthesis
VVDLTTQLLDIKPDVIYLHQFHDEALWSELLDVAAKLSVPVVQFIHDHRLFCLRRHKYTAMGEQTCTRVTSRLACYPCLGFVERERSPGVKLPIRLRTYSTLDHEQSLARRFDAHVVGSSYMREHVRAHGFAAARVHHIPLGVRRPDASVDASIDAAEPRSLLFVGALLKGKGLDLLFSAMASLPSDVRLKVVGEGAQESVYRDQVNELGLSGRVDFAGRLGGEALSAAYQAAAAVVVPSRAPETFGFVGPEALLHGTPVIASAVGGTGDWLRHGKTGLAFESGSVDALRAAIERTLGDRDEARTLAAAGRQLCLDAFDQTRHVAEVASLFRELTGSVARAS